MTTKLIALWTAPEDIDGFEADYLATHAPLAAAIPGVTFSAGRCAPGGPYYRFAELAFGSGDALGAGLGSPEGAAVSADGQRLQDTFGNKLDVLIVTGD
ncbi:MAG TPA: EthD family reductase [Acidimicrobiales bacterium]|nr:EthD family reductase [Acidimicrobiales bacterium]